MPTEAEFKELYNSCTSEWTTLNGVRGRKLTSKKNGNSIFLPAAGALYNDEDFPDYPDTEGLFGDYWSSSVFMEFPESACGMGFDSDTISTSICARPAGLSIRPVNDEPADYVSGVSLNKSVITLAEGDSEALRATVYPSNAINRNVTWSSSHTDVATVNENGLVKAIKPGEVTITVRSLEGGHTATCAVTVTAGIFEPEAVDLGLPSGLKWSSCNLGASKSEEYGGCYQWGDLPDISDTSIYLDWNSCPYHTGTVDNSGWTKYIPSNKSSYWSGTGNPDNKTILDPGDDVVHVKWGGKWRMPTEAEFDELIDNCSSEWTTLNGVSGMKFTSKKNGKSIFLPAAGERCYDFLISVGSSGNYWSSSLNTDDPSSAYRMDFFPFSGLVFTDYVRRCFGLSVRPVSE